MVEEECIAYLDEKWGDEGKLDLQQAMAEMIVFTATRCLHGKETRDVFNAGEVADIYSDLDGGFSPQAWFFPPWFPFPSFAKRDKAHLDIKSRFAKVIAQRKEVRLCSVACSARSSSLSYLLPSF
jgi:sterol 14-demethylase